MIFFILKKLFLISVYQNDPKTLKNINFKQKKFIKKKKHELNPVSKRGLREVMASSLEKKK